MEIEVFGTPACGICKQVVAFLKKEDVQYNYKTVGEDISIEVLGKLIGRTPRGVPVILIDGVEYAFGMLKERIKTSKDLGSLEI